MPTGKIKWFNRAIGAGFIRSDEGENVFFRDSAVHSTDSNTLRQGQIVCFEIVKNIRSISQTAANVRSFELPLNSR
jgi:cold shock CspA family protein